MVKAVRGAVSLEEDSPEELREKVGLLYSTLEERNGFCEEDVVSILFSQTEDISYNPAKALREAAGLSQAPLFCTQEPRCVDFPQKRMLRLLVTFQDEKPGRGVPVYLGEAASLREDLRAPREGGGE